MILLSLPAVPWAGAPETLKEIEETEMYARKVFMDVMGEWEEEIGEKWDIVEDNDEKED